MRTHFSSIGFRGPGTVALVLLWAVFTLVLGARSAVAQDVIRCQDGTADDYPCENVDLLAHLPSAEVGGGSNVDLNDVWGWTDPETGTEYALLGRMDGVAFVDVSTPTDPVYVGELPTQTEKSVWRDVKVYDDHAFIVSEASGHGMQVFDLTRLRTVAATERPVSFEATAHYDEVERAHNVVINRESGYAYIVGGNGNGETCGGGLHMVDIETPDAPTFAGCFADPSTGRSGTGYTHDAQCVTYAGPDEAYRDREVCFNANETAVNIADVTSKRNPTTITNATYPQVGYTHQVWLTEDQRYLYVDDELDEARGFVDRTRTLVFDVSDLDSPELVTTYSGETSAIDHNQYIDGIHAYQANYRSGLRILDVASPESPAEVAFFDTYPQNDDASFDGAWSVYPFFERNIVIVSSIGEGLFVLRPRVSPILGIDGERQGSDVQLTWSISSSADTDRIEVEHKPPESLTWALDGTLAGKRGESIRRYEYRVSDLRPGTHAFRIRHVATDGTSYRSDSVAVRVLPTEAFIANGPFPNPARDQSTFKLTLREPQTVRLALYDALGREVRVLHDGFLANGVIHRFEMQARRRASGVYFLHVRGESLRLTRKLVVGR